MSAMFLERCYFCTKAIPDEDCVYMLTHSCVLVQFHSRCCEAGRVILWFTVGPIERVGLAGKGHPGPIDSGVGY